MAIDSTVFNEYRNGELELKQIEAESREDIEAYERAKLKFEEDNAPLVEAYKARIEKIKAAERALKELEKPVRAILSERFISILPIGFSQRKNKGIRILDENKIITVATLIKNRDNAEGNTEVENAIVAGLSFNPKPLADVLWKYADKDGALPEWMNDLDFVSIFYEPSGVISKL